MSPALDLEELFANSKAQQAALERIQWLCRFVGTETQLAVTHPLISIANNLRLLQSSSISLPIASLRQLGLTYVRSDTLQRFESDWAGKEHFRRAMRTPDKFKATCFELDTFYVLEAEGLAAREETTWSTLAENTPDWKIGQRYSVECKVATVERSVFDPQSSLKAANKQHRELNAPLLVAIGVALSTPSLVKSLARRADWFVEHPNVSGAMIISRHQRPPWNIAILGRSHAKHPLPSVMATIGTRQLTIRYGTPGDPSSRRSRGDQHNDATR